MSRRRFPKTAAGIVLACTLLLAACSSTDSGDGAATSTPSEASAQLAGTSWVLESMGDQQAADDTSATLQFSEDGEVSGSGGCNNYSGEFTTDGETLKVGELAVTLMACEGPVGDQESAFHNALAQARHFTVDEDTLMLSDEDGRELLVFAAQANELVGTWIVTGYNDGEEAVVGVLDDTEAEVSFDDEGNISGTGGCNRLMGTFTAEQGALNVDPMAMTKMACPEPLGVMEQEAALILALESAATYRVEGNELRLATSEDETAVTFIKG